MKKALLYCLSLVLILSLTACGNQADTSGIAGNMENNGNISSGQAGTASSGPSENRDTGDRESGQAGQQAGQTQEQEQTGGTGEVGGGQTSQQAGGTGGTEQQAPGKAEKAEPFTSVNETVYATGTVNLRSSYSTKSDKVGGLTKGQSVTRIGVGTGEADGWSKVQLSDGSIVYVSSTYLSTTKSTSGGNGGNTSKPATPPSKPATPPTTPKPSQSSGGGSSEEEDSGSSFQQRMQEMQKNLEGAKGKVDPNAPKDSEGNPITGKV